ncbi:MAG: Uma2 family endonuclease [Bacteroidetes bacterium SW_9_63_38]|nr:MAG: Uma2 family endonuclease [Bacteroidetes bacterium SW_9_63_38]
MESERTLSDYERERGKPMPSKLHSVVQTNLLGILLSYRPEYQGLSELTLQLDGRELTPDLCVYPDLDVDFTQDETQVTEPPLLAVEISSHTQGVQTLVDKTRVLLAHGVESCWLIQPQLRTVTVFTGEMDSATHDRGVLTDPATDMEVDLNDVFSAP